MQDHLDQLPFFSDDYRKISRIKAHYELGILQIEGEGCEQNIEDGVSNLIIAAEQDILPKIKRKAILYLLNLKCAQINGLSGKKLGDDPDTTTAKDTHTTSSVPEIGTLEWILANDTFDYC